MKKYKKILSLFLLLLLFPLSSIGKEVANFLVGPTFDFSINKPNKFLRDSLKLKTFACNFAPSLWLKADEGITLNNSTVTTWADQSGNANNAIQNTINRRPTYQENSINFNPALNFDGANDFLQGTGGFSNTTLFMVARSDLTITNASPGQTIITANITNPASDAYFFTLGSVTAAFNNEVITHGLGNSTEYRKVLTGNFSIPNVSHLYSVDHEASIRDAAIYFDGLKIDNNTANTFINPQTNRPYRVGGNLYVWSDIYFNGQIAEILSFPTNLSSNDREIISSYLGIKYGISLAHTYRDVDGITIWNEVDFPNNIAGIGRNDCFNLNQKQTKSAQSGAVLTIGLGAIATDNSSNNTNFNNDQSFLLWGHDNDDNGTIEETTAEVPIGIQKRLDREWKIRNTNAVGIVEAQFNLNGIAHAALTVNDLFLLIDEDGDSDFTSGTIQQIPATSFNNGIVSFPNLNLTDDVIISLATMLSPNTAPQIICTNVSFEVCPNGQTYEIASAIQVNDLDNDNVTAEITISGMTENSDILMVDLTGFSGINQSYIYPTLQITGIITPSELQNILRTLNFVTTSTLVGSREINIILNDGITNSNEITKSIQADENLSICCSANAPLISN